MSCAKIKFLCLACQRLITGVETTMPDPYLMPWVLLYYWVRTGKWRRWCIPGAFCGPFVFRITVSLCGTFNNSLVIIYFLRPILRSLFTPVILFLKLASIHDSRTSKCIILIWCVIVGAIAGAIARILSLIFKRKSLSEDANVQVIKKIEL